MKRPRRWLPWLFFIGMLLVLGEYVALTWFAPTYVLRAIERIVGGSLSIGKVRLSLPLTTTLANVYLASNTTAAALLVQRTVIRPRWISLPTKTVWINSLEIERPMLRVTRTQEGTFRWPTIPQPRSARMSRWSSWQLQIDSLKVVDGVLEFVDERPATPFHGLLDHLSFVVGPITWPAGGAQTSFAVRGEVVGFGGAGAPLYCSGWVDLVTRDLQASCQLEPLALEAFDAYFHGPLEVRVYAGTLKSTSQWIAKANELKGRVQLELNHLNEADLSIHGRTIIDVKKLTGQGEPRLSGELQLTGSLDDPARWEGAFAPGDERAQELIHKFLERGIQIVKVPLGNHRLGVHIAPSSPAVQTDIEAASSEVQEALELLAAPIPSETPPVEAPAGVATPTAPAATTIPPTPEGFTPPPPIVTPQPSPTLPPEASSEQSETTNSSPSVSPPSVSPAESTAPATH